jgi:DNA polymerase-1
MSKAAKKLFIIDGHAHIYAAYYAPMRPLTSPSGEPTKAVFVFTNAILGLLEREKPDMLVVTMDSKTPSFRAEIYPEYKAHRPPMPEDMPAQINRIEQILEAMNIPMLRIDGWEADDLIGTLATQAAKAGIDAYICSKDKDMLQLLQKHVSTYDIKTGQKTDLQKLHEEIGLRPQQFIDVLALQGDASDNVPGVPDVGPKTALEWIQKYGSLDELYKHADDIKGKRGDNLRNSKEIAYLSQKLVTIDCDAPVKLDEKTFAVSRPDKEKLASLFKELGFTRLLSQLNIKSEQACGVPVASKQSGDGSDGIKQEARSVSDGTSKEKSKESPGSAGQGMLFAVAAEKTARTTNKNYHLIDTPQKFDEFFRELYRQKIFAVDTETTSIDPMRAELVGLSFCWKERQAFYLPVRAPLGQKRLDVSKIHPILAPIFADPKRYKIGQNLKYDMLILENAGMPLAIAPGGAFDTMVASYCLHADRSSHSMDAMAKDYLNYEPIPISELIGKGKNQITFDRVDTAAACEYSAEDADVTYQLWQYLSARLDAQPSLKKLFEEVEMPLVSVLARMEFNGVSLDTDLLGKMSKSIKKQVEQLTDKIFAIAGLPFNIDSTKQLGEVLFDRLGLQSVRQGKTQRSTDADVLDQLSGQHPIVPLLLEYRQLVKLQNTYIDKLPLLVNPKTQRVHASFNQTVTATGRLSSSDPNLQNIPIRTEVGKQIRSAFVPKDKNSCILSADYSQIELRLLAHFSKDKALLKAFADDMDIHTFVASQIYGIPVEEVSSEMRTKAKAVNFGIIYGQGPFGLSQTVGISQAEAKKFIDEYYARYPSIRKFMDGEIDKAAKLGYAQTILGRRRPITGLDSKNHNVRSLAQRLAVNTVIQGSAADLIKMAMIAIQRRIEKEKLPIKMILQIHDELVFELPEKDARTQAEWIAVEMTSAIRLDVPLKVDISIGESWLE